MDISWLTIEALSMPETSPLMLAVLLVVLV
jgi:hypothetical protein